MHAPAAHPPEEQNFSSYSDYAQASDAWSAGWNFQGSLPYWDGFGPQPTYAGFVGSFSSDPGLEQWYATGIADGKALEAYFAGVK